MSVVEEETEHAAWFTFSSGSIERADIIRLHAVEAPLDGRRRGARRMSVPGLYVGTKPPGFALGSLDGGM